MPKTEKWRYILASREYSARKLQVNPKDRAALRQGCGGGHLWMKKERMQ